MHDTTPPDTGPRCTAPCCRSVASHTSTDVAAFLDYLDAVGYSPHTIRAYRRALDLYAAWLAPRERAARSVTFDELVAYAAQLDGSRRTRRLRLAAVRALHAWLAASGRAARDVGRSVRLPRHGPSRDRLRLPLTRDDVLHLERVADDMLDRFTLATMYGCALRVSEAIRLRRSDVDLRSRLVSVYGKGRRQRLVRIPPGWTFDALAAAHDAADDHLAPARRAGSSRPHVTAQTIARRLHALAEHAGLDRRRVHPHALRHARAMHLADDGVDAAQLAAILGHQTVQTTALYMHRDGRADVGA